MLIKKNIWLVGASNMAVDYFKVLRSFHASITVIGRGEASSKKFHSKTDFKPIVGGFKNFLKSKPKKCDSLIIAVSIDNLAKIALQAIDFGIKNILLEKPGALELNEILSIKNKAKKYNVNVHIAYNRRFYASTLRAKEIIKNDRGVKSFNFEFTEWSNIVEKSNQNQIIKEKWFIANSSHVADLAFFLGGFPTSISSYTYGSLSWHKSASIFTGSGKTDIGALFSYQANWECPGRWSLEVLTNNNRLIFKPMEKLFIQKKGEISIIEDSNLNYEIDEKFKPGLYNQTKSFLKKEFKDMLSINDLPSFVNIYNKIANY